MRRISWLAVLVTAAAVPLFGLGCASAHGRLITLTNSDSGRSVTVAVGSEIDVTLQTIGPGQYGSPALSSKCVRFVGVSLAGSPNPGGPRQLFRFEAKAPGQGAASPSATRVARQEARRRLPSGSLSRCTEPQPVGGGADEQVTEVDEPALPSSSSRPQAPSRYLPVARRCIRVGGPSLRPLAAVTLAQPDGATHSCQVDRPQSGSCGLRNRRGHHRLPKVSKAPDKKRAIAQAHLGLVPAGTLTSPQARGSADCPCPQEVHDPRRVRAVRRLPRPQACPPAL